MVQLRILSGSKAGLAQVARRFPVRIGRLAENDLQLEDDGVWDRHVRIVLERGKGFVMMAEPDALASVNGQTVGQAVLRNGDVIGIGSSKLQFWLSETRQAGLRFREGLTWAAIAAVSLGQVVLVYLLLR